MALVNHDIPTQRQEGYPPLVLAVDDDSDNLLLLSYILEEFNCMILAEKDGRAALEIAQKIKPELILLDILLPSLNGIEIVRHLKSNSATSGIPVVAITALARRDDKERLLAEGFSSYISKPYLLAEVEQIIGYHLIKL